MACYLAISSKRGNSQRITLPTKLLKKKKWAKTKMYLLCDHHEGHITLRPYDLDPLHKMIKEQDHRTDKKQPERSAHDNPTQNSNATSG